MNGPATSAGAVLSAPAKLTRSLRITGVRADGYHLLDAEMITLRWADRLTITGAETTSIRVSGPFADGVPTDDGNLVWRALALTGRPAHVDLDKQLPHGGGLGGGSADAAAVLRWAGVSDPTVAASLGADVPFCVVGGRARVTGVGEIVEPLEEVDVAVTLVVPPLAVSTPAAYRAWDQLGGPVGDAGNDLEPAALAVEPALAGWRQRITDAAGRRPMLAGSGATWFLEGDDIDVGALRAALPDALVVRTRTGRRS